MSLRRLTSIQFSDGTSISGENLEGAWSDVQRRFDALKVMDVAREWWETQLVFGYEPRRPSWGELVETGPDTGIFVFVRPREFPWLPLQTLITEPNVSQFKGADFPGMSPPDYGKGYVWGFGWTSGEEPSVISAADLCMTTDPENGIYPVGWQWLSDMPDGIEANDFVEDCGFEIVVDHPTSQGDPDSTSVLCYKASISVDSQYQSDSPAFGNDGIPAYPTGPGGFEGVWFHADKLMLPIPPKARVRVFIVLPDYVNALDSAGDPIAAGAVRWRTTVNAPWSQQCYSGSVTVLLPRGEVK